MLILNTTSTRYPLQSQLAQSLEIRRSVVRKIRKKVNLRFVQYGLESQWNMNLNVIRLGTVQQNEIMLYTHYDWRRYQETIYLHIM